MVKGSPTGHWLRSYVGSSRPNLVKVVWLWKHVLCNLCRKPCERQSAATKSNASPGYSSRRSGVGYAERDEMLAERYNAAHTIKKPNEVVHRPHSSAHVALCLKPWPFVNP